MKVRARYEMLGEAESRAAADARIDWLRRFGERRVNSFEIDERRTIPPHVALEFGNQGLMGMQVETRYGGLGLRTRDMARVLEQASAIDLSLGTFLLVCLGPGVRPIAAFGSEELKAEWLPDLAAGRVLAGYAQSEPGAGANFAALEATATAADGGGWRLSGDKVWIGNATWAGLLTAMAQEVDASGRSRSLLALAVRTDQPGVHFGREMASMGMRGVIQAEVSFRDVAIDPDRRLGAAGRGVEVGVDSMSWSRFIIAATCLGAMKRSAQLLLRFAGRRSIATGRLLDHPVVLDALGDTVARVATSGGLVYHVADLLDEGEGVAPELFAACKIATAEFLGQSVDRMVQALGSRGYDEATGVPQLARDARVTRIFEGPTEALLGFVGAATLSRNSPVDVFLRQRLAADAEADRLEAAVARLREREAALDRAASLDLAGWAGTWALLAGVARADAASAPSAAAERTQRWAELGFATALADAAQGAAAESVRWSAADAEKAVSAFADGIGDVEQTLPGERRTPDPWLRREFDGS